MAKKIKIIDYDRNNDILFISNDEKIKSSIDIGDFVLDLNGNNLIAGVEVMDASENLGIGKKELMNIAKAKISINYKTNHVYVLLGIVLKNTKKEINVSIPLALSLGHKEPKKELLIYN